MRFMRKIKDNNCDLTNVGIVVDNEFQDIVLLDTSVSIYMGYIHMRYVQAISAPV